MIPLTLKLKNFLSYGADLQTIDFAPYHLICLSGKNGHGKSALLDAMTWAVWGTARKVLNATKPDQGLLRLGQSQMMVIFDFMLNDMHYRVRREFSIVRGKPYAQLDFGTVNQQTQQFMPLTDKTIRSTQTMIEHTIGLSFDTFVNSAFIRQGQSNEFSKKSPKDRKDILAHILGLDQYESLRSSALEKIKEYQAKKNALDMFNEKRALALQKKEQLVAEGMQIETQKNTLTLQAKTYQEQQEQLNQQEKALQELRNHHSLVQFACNARQRTIQESQQQLRTSWSQWRQVHRAYRQLPDFHTLQEKKYALLQEIATHQKQQQAYLQHKEQILVLERALHEYEQKHQKTVAEQIAQARLLFEQKKLEKITHDTMLKSQAQEQKTLEQELANVARKIVTLETSLQTLAKQQLPSTFLAQFEKRKSCYQQYITIGNLLKQELSQLAHKTTLVHEEDPSCPLCEQNLSLSRRRFLKTKFTEQEQRINHQLKRLSTIVQKLKALLLEQHSTIEQHKKLEQQLVLETTALREMRALQEKIEQKLAQIQAQITHTTMQCNLLEKEYSSHQQLIDHLVQEGLLRLQADQQFQALKQSLATAQQVIQQTTLNPDQMLALQKSVEETEYQLIHYKEFQQRYEQQPAKQAEVNSLCRALKELYREQREQIAQIKQMEERIKDDALLHAAKQQLSIAIAGVQKELASIAHLEGSLQAQMHALEQLDREQQEALRYGNLIKDEMYDYQQIAQILSKDGIQALLIEDTVPELEYEANQLLAKLTNNQSQLFFECMRDLKHGGTKETLDIKIADASGIRPYELFSGGEAFRIDFSLRIALAKLLAHRSGTALQTLIIDEGFGSQDEEGLNHIMDAIHKIQDDFAKVIIVSHLPFMKEQFPVHFIVEKGAQGSQIQVMHY